MAANNKPWTKKVVEYACPVTGNVLYTKEENIWGTGAHQTKNKGADAVRYYDKGKRKLLCYFDQEALWYDDHGQFNQRAVDKFVWFYR